MKLVLNPEERLCSVCPGGATKMIQIPRTKSWICSICSGSEWHYANQEPTEEEIE